MMYNSYDMKALNFITRYSGSREITTDSVEQAITKMQDRHCLRLLIDALKSAMKDKRKNKIDECAHLKMLLKNNAYTHTELIQSITDVYSLPRDTIKVSEETMTKNAKMLIDEIIYGLVQLGDNKNYHNLSPEEVSSLIQNADYFVLLGGMVTENGWRDIIRETVSRIAWTDAEVSLLKEHRQSIKKSRESQE